MTTTAPSLAAFAARQDSLVGARPLADQLDAGEQGPARHAARSSGGSRCSSSRPIGTSAMNSTRGFAVRLRCRPTRRLRRRCFRFRPFRVDPYEATHFRVAARARALHAAAAGTARLIVASAAALLPRVSSQERPLRASVELRLGYGNRAAAIGRPARRCRLFSRGPSRRARRLCRPRRHCGRVSPPIPEPARTEFGDT